MYELKETKNGFYLTFKTDFGNTASIFATKKKEVISIYKRVISISQNKSEKLKS